VVRSSFVWYRFVESPKALCLHLEIGFDVAMSREWMGMAQKQRDNFERDAGLKHGHRGRMSKGMAGNAAALERWALARGLANGQCQPKRHAIVAERSTGSVREDKLFWSDVLCLTPLAERAHRCGPKRNDSLPSSLAVKLDCAVTQILRAKLECFRNPRSGVVDQGEEPPVSAPGRCRGIGGSEHRIDLGTAHEAEHRFYGLFLCIARRR
jgi:hypothetical protein